jgi:hypothetical protein
MIAAVVYRWQRVYHNHRDDRKNAGINAGIFPGNYTSGKENNRTKSAKPYAPGQQKKH